MEKTDKAKESDHTFLITTRIFDLLSQAIAVGLYLGLGWIGLQAIEALAGKTTVTNFLVNFLMGWDTSLEWILFVVALLYATGQQRLRRRTTRLLERRIRELETRIDPDRKSSGLLSTGETNPRDL